jgi:anti-anti-sigma factor
MSELAQIEFEPRDGAVLVRITGEIDISNVDNVAAELASLQTRGGRIVIDLSALAFIDSSGVRLLASMADQARAREAPLHFVVPEDAAIHRIVTLVDLPSLAVFHNRVEDALA